MYCVCFVCIEFVSALLNLIHISPFVSCLSTIHNNHTQHPPTHTTPTYHISHPPPLPQILGTRKAVTTLSSLLPIRIILAADLLNALVVLCTNNTTHQRMLLDAGALPWLLAFAAGSTKPGEDPLGRRGQERGERGTGAAGQERGGGGAAGGQHNNTGGQHNNTAGNNNDNRMTQASNVQANNPQSSNGAATSNGVQGDAGVGVPCDDWPIVRMFAAELLDMVGDAVDPVTGMVWWGVEWGEVGCMEEDEI